MTLTMYILKQWWWILKGFFLDLITPRCEDQLGNRLSAGKNRSLAVIHWWTKALGIAWVPVNGAGRGLKRIAARILPFYFPSVYVARAWYHYWRMNRQIQRIARKSGAPPGLTSMEFLKWAKGQLEMAGKEPY